MALGFMRRHRRWLYVFLWVVVAAFIILYIPAFTGMGDDSAAGATLVEVGSLPITVGEYQKAYLRQREMYQSMYQGRLDNEMLKRMGLEEQTLQVARSTIACSSWRPRGSASPWTTRPSASAWPPRPSSRSTAGSWARTSCAGAWRCRA